MSQAFLESHIPNLKLLNRGKVRDIYSVDDKHLLLITSDRTSAFDVVLNQGIPDKGRVLTQISSCWFDFFQDQVQNHLVEDDVYKIDCLQDLGEYRKQLEARTLLVKRASMYPVECVVRGYIVGSGWKDYQKNGSVCGIALPENLQQASRLEEPIFTPATKAEQGEHDENISFERMKDIIGSELAHKLRDLSIEIYTKARSYALERGIILADTKFEFGEYDGETILCDEVLTPDSSRFWDVQEYREGISPPSFDKQIIRDWLQEQPWDKTPPAPDLPQEIIEHAKQRYNEVFAKLFNKSL